MNILKLSFIIVLAQFGMLSTLDAQVITGSAKLERASFDFLTISGSLDFNDLTIEKILTVNGSIKGQLLKCQKFIINGSFKGENIKAQYGRVSGSLSVKKTTIEDDLTVSGSLTGNEIKVSGKTKIDGNLNASESSFSDIEVASCECTLTNSKAKNVFVKKNKHESQRIYLNGNTVIEGDIIFESLNGKVICSGEAKVLGKVQGASIVKPNGLQ